MRSRLDSRRSFRPLLEVLEARTLLSIYTVDRLSDVRQQGDEALLRMKIILN